MTSGKMTFDIILVILILSLGAVGAAFARDASHGAPAAIRTAMASHAKGDHAKGDKAKGDKVKGEKAAAKSGQGLKASPKPQAPIVMGRSVMVLHHKTKVHHLKMKPLDTAEGQESKDKPR